MSIFLDKNSVPPKFGPKIPKNKIGDNKSLELVTWSIFELQKKVRGVSESAESQLFIYEIIFSL